jgi:hypothetical protein
MRATKGTDSPALANIGEIEIDSSGISPRRLHVHDLTVVGTPWKDVVDWYSGTCQRLVSQRMIDD